MGLGRVFHRVLSDQSNPGMLTFASILANNGSAFYATDIYRGAMTIPGVYRAATLIADLIGGLPWQAYSETDGELTKIPTPPLLEQPAPPEMRVSTFSSWALDLLMDGNAFGIIADRDADGNVTAVAPVPAQYVGVRLDEGQVVYQVGASPFNQYHVEAKTYYQDEVIHIKGWSPPGSLRGYGALEAHLNGIGSLDLASELARQARSVSQNGVPTGIVKVTNPDATKDDLLAAKAGWLNAQRDRTVAVLNASTDFTPLSWNPEQMQLIEARKYSLHEVALIFGVPLYFLGAATESRTYANVEQEGLNLLKYSLNGHLARFEQTLSAQFVPGTCVKANIDALLRTDTLTRYQAHAAGVNAGFLSPNEARLIENLPPVDGLDKGWQESIFKSPPAPQPPPVPGANPADTANPAQSGHPANGGPANG